MGVGFNPLRKNFNPNRVMNRKNCVSIRVILNNNAIVTLFPDGQFSARFDFAQGVPSNPLRVFGSIVVINAIQNPDENCHSYTESPIRLKIAAVSAKVERTRLGVSFFVEIRPNYFSIATVTFRIALISTNLPWCFLLHR